MSGSTRIRFQGTHRNYYRIYEVTSQAVLLNQVNLNDGFIHLSSDESDSDSDSSGDTHVPDAPPNTPEDNVGDHLLHSPLDQLVQDMLIQDIATAPAIPPGFEHVTPTLPPSTTILTTPVAATLPTSPQESHKGNSPNHPTNDVTLPPPSLSTQPEDGVLFDSQTLVAIPALALIQSDETNTESKRRKIGNGQTLCDAEVEKFLFDCMRILSRCPKSPELLPPFPAPTNPLVCEQFLWKLAPELPEPPSSLLSWWLSSKELPGWCADGFGILAHPNDHNGLSWEILPMAREDFRDTFLQCISFYYFAATDGPLIFPSNKYKPPESWFYFISTNETEATNTPASTVSADKLPPPPLDLNTNPQSEGGSNLLRKRIPHAALTLDYVQKRLKFFETTDPPNPNTARKAAKEEPSKEP